MAIHKVLLLGNPALRTHCNEVTGFNNDLNDIITNLKDTLNYILKKGIYAKAISAPLISIHKRVVYIQTRRKTIIMVNPVIKEFSEEMVDSWESSLCFEQAFFVKIPRHEWVEVEYNNEKGESVTERFKKDYSKVVQHEIDHLNGIVSTDHLKNPKSEIVMRSEWAKM